MANGLYTKGKESILDNSVKWVSDNIKVVLVDTGMYTLDLSTDTFLSDIPSGARIALTGVLTSRTATGGVADAADISVTTVTGSEVDALVIYSDTGLSSSSRLIAYIDSPDALPFTPNGGGVTISWPDDGIFSLG